MDTDGLQTPEHGYTISSPNGSGELKSVKKSVVHTLSNGWYFIEGQTRSLKPPFLQFDKNVTQKPFSFKNVDFRTNPKNVSETPIHFGLRKLIYRPKLISISLAFSPENEFEKCSLITLFECRVIEKNQMNKK